MTMKVKHIITTTFSNLVAVALLVPHPYPATYRKEDAISKKARLLPIVAAFGLLSVSAPVSQAHAQGSTSKDFVPPIVFQAAGPTAASIQGSVDEYRAALGEPDNRNDPGPLASGRREINWDGGGNNQNTAVAGNPFAGFQVTRGALFTTPDGTEFVQAPPAADPALFPPGGLAGLIRQPDVRDHLYRVQPAAAVQRHWG